VKKKLAPPLGPSEISHDFPLIMTKIQTPRRRSNLLPRPRLVEYIHSSIECKLVLISAPAGYGKTSLLTEYAYETDLPVCWYTLDVFDRDLRIFVEYFIASIALQFPGFGKQSQAVLRQSNNPGGNLYQIISTLVQEIYEKIPEYFVLILDDHHTIEEQEEIHMFLDLLLTYVDENFHLIIASRTLPELPNLSLLVARGQATGLSIDELRFTPGEVQELVSQNYEMKISPKQAEALVERTGGWITGLLMTDFPKPGILGQATKQLQLKPKSNNLYDYFSRQVLDQQSDDLRNFL
jgi:LuxR family maltose regulon positive regulatory protein